MVSDDYFSKQLLTMVDQTVKLLSSKFNNSTAFGAFNTSTPIVQVGPFKVLPNNVCRLTSVLYSTMLVPDIHVLPILNVFIYGLLLEKNISTLFCILVFINN